MLRGGSVLKLLELRAQGKSIRDIARITGHSRNTVRKYLRDRGESRPKPRRRRASKLEPYLDELHYWMGEGVFNCEVLLEKLQAKGYTGSRTILKDYVKRFRPPRRPKAVMRYETRPGEQAQVDWGICSYVDSAGGERKLNVFVMTMGYSRDTYVEFTSRADISTFLRCMTNALLHFGGSPQNVLFDNPKIVVLGRDESGEPRWNPLFADFALAVGFVPRLCQPRRPQTKGKVESGIKFVKGNFWPGRRFTDLADLNHQALAWCESKSRRVHGTTGERPCDRRPLERANLRALPTPAVLDRFLSETRFVSRDGFVSFDGSRYGVPWKLAGLEVQVRQSGGYVEILHHGERVALHPKALLPRTTVPLVGQYQDIPLSQTPRYQPPTAVQLRAPEVEVRSLQVYEQLAGGVHR
ncbi:IS21 family transposase [Symbiobacterium terraclitae]|uniref:IS21 family transposase n=1 Tax=Symbiobacterium terraclitae TaxID=557451 RepID=UPI0035B55957